jgi:anti-sigma regulatory factor (Ser/Thr protein kinase)
MTAAPEATDTPADRPIARVSVPATMAYLAPTLSFVHAVSERLGLAPAAATALAEAVERAAVNVIEHAFDPGETGSFDVVLRRRPGAVACSVEDLGLPFDFRPLGDGPGSVLGHLATKGLIDAAHFANLGVHGNRVEIVKRLPSPAAGRGAAPPPPEVPAAPHDTPVALRLMTPDDGEAVARCTYRTYGYTAPDEKLYDPDHLRQLLENGLYEACVGVTPDGEVVSFADLELDRPDAVAGNAGEAMVDPRFRGHALFEKMKRFFKERAAARGLLGIYAEAVTVHPFSQKGEIAIGAHETGVHLADEAPRVVFKDIAGGAAPRRTATVLYYLQVAPHPPRVVFPPARHRDVIARIYAEGEFRRELREPGGAPDLPASARLRMDVFPDWSEASLAVTRYGRDLPQLVGARLRELCLRRIDWIGLDLPLAEPGAALLCPALEALGFFFAGVIPELSGGDVLRLQYLNEIEPDLDPHLASDFGRELFRYVVAARPA